MRFVLTENPSFLLLLLLPPLVWLVGFSFSLRKRKNIKKLLGERNFQFLTSSVSLRKREWKRVLECLAFSFFILAFLRPQWGTSTQKIKNHGIELILLFDISKSMLAEDVLPSRLEFAKKEMNRFLDLSYGDKIGLVVFAGSSILLSPMTTDYSALKMYIESLTVDSVSRQGTDFRRALLEAKEAFKRGGIEESEKHNVTRAILIFSDGEDNEKGALEMVHQLKEEGTHIFSLLVGTKKGAPIRFKNSSGEVQGFQKDASGRIVLTQASDALLRELALKGGGSFYHVVYGGKAIEKTREDIELLQKNEFQETQKNHYNEKYQFFLLLGFLAALIELFLSEKRFSKTKWKGRFFVSLFFFFFLSHFSFKDFQFLNSEASLKMIYKNNQGVKALVNQEPQKAKEHFLDGLKKEPLNPLLQFHLALTFEQEGEKEKAIQQYKTTLRLLSKIKIPQDKIEVHQMKAEIQFKTLFNLARLLSQEKEEISQALDFYQKALDIQPHSKEIKTNIELLWKRLSSEQKTEEKKEDKDSKKEKENQQNQQGEEENKKNQNQEEKKDNSKDSSGELNQEEKEEGNSKESKQKENQERKNSEKNQKTQESQKDKKESKDSPRPFKGKSLTEEDVFRILEEIKNQEQKIRAKELSKQPKEAAREKDW